MNLLIGNDLHYPFINEKIVKSKAGQPIAL